MKNLQICFEYKAKITNKIPKLRDWLETFVLLSEDFFSSGGLTPILSFLWNVSFHHDPIKVFLVAWSASNYRAKVPLYAADFGMQFKSMIYIWIKFCLKTKEFLGEHLKVTKLLRISTVIT